MRATARRCSITAEATVAIPSESPATSRASRPAPGPLIIAAPAFLAGTALGAVSVVGGALLLFVGARALSATGALLALTIASVAAGVWSAQPAAGFPRGRWRGAALSVLAAALFALFWTEPATLGGDTLMQASGSGEDGGAWIVAAAVVLLLALPAYALGGLIAALQARRRGAVVPALLGVAVAAVAAAVLAPKLGAMEVLFTAAVFVTVGGVLEAGGAASAAEGSDDMGDVVLVTGVGRKGQVGYALARALLERGATVAITNLHDSVEQLGAELGEEAGAADRLLVHHGDLRRASVVDELIGAIGARFGRLDGLVNLAGGLTVIKTLGETTDEEYAREMERNALTTFIVTRAALPLLRASRGAVVNFASPAGERAMPRLGAYSAAKAGVIAMTRALAIEEAPNGVRVNAVAPGLIDTASNRNALGQDPDARWVTREQVAEVVIFLLGAAAAGVTGETMHVVGEGIE